jgi:hypothetical protein
MVRHAPPDLWFDPDKNNSRLLAAMSELRHLCTRAEHTVPLTRQAGSRVFIKDHVGDRRLCRVRDRSPRILLEQAA